MFAGIRSLILAVLILIFTVMNSQKTAAAPEKLVQEKVASPLLKSVIDEDSRQNSTCIAPDGPCKLTCECCSSDFQYLCSRNEEDGKRYCSSPRGAPHKCPVDHGPCKSIQGACTRDCDCCQRDEQEKPAAVNCYIEQSAELGTCHPQPFVIEDCVRPPPPPEA